MLMFDYIPSSSIFFGLPRQCRRKIAFSQFAPVKIMLKQYKLFSNCASEIVVYAGKMVICLGKMISLHQYFLLS